MNQMQNDGLDFRAILEKLNLVDVRVSFRSGSVARSKDRGTKYTGNAFTAGSVKYIDPKVLAPFSRSRQAIARLCRMSGGKFFGGVAMGDKAVPKFTDKLKILLADFEKEKEQLSKVLRIERERWEASHPEIMEFASFFPTDQQILDSISTSVMTCKLEPSTLVGVEDGLEATVKGFARQVLDEIAQDAADSFDPMSKKASTRSRAILGRIKAKLDSLAFVDTSLGDVSNMVQKVLRMLPYEGPVKDGVFTVYSSLMSILSNPDTVVGVAKGMEVSAMVSCPEDWFALVAEDVTVAEPQVEAGAVENDRMRRGTACEGDSREAFEAEMVVDDDDGRSMDEDSIKDAVNSILGGDAIGELEDKEPTESVSSFDW